MRRLLAGLAAFGLGLGAANVLTAQSEPTVEHVSVRAGEGLWAVASRLCPGGVAAQFTALQQANPWYAVGLHPGTVLHVPEGTCPAASTTSTTGATTTWPSTTTSSTATSTTPTTTASTPATVPPSSVPPSSVSPTSPTSTSTPTPTTAPPANGFLETFDGLPTNPAPWNPVDWDVFQTSRDRQSWILPDPMSAHHAMSNCGDVAAGGAHEIDEWAETVFLCNNHVMTSIDGTPGYAAVYLSPPAMMDFANGPSTLGFDVSTFVSSNRDWIDVTITAPGDVMSYPFRSDLGVDGSGPPANSLHIEQTFGSESWIIELVRDGVPVRLGELRVPYAQFGGQSRVTRTPVRVVVSSTSLTLSYPTVPGSAVTVTFPALSWAQGVVQFGHHSYTPYKDCTATSSPDCGPDTWHWDNIAIAPSLPFYQRQATPERTGAPIYDSGVRHITFAEPAPAGAQLAFGGECGVEVRDNVLAPWRPVTIIGPNDHPEHAQSYTVAVAEGSTGVDYRFVDNGWYHLGYGCQIQNPIVKVLG